MPYEVRVLQAGSTFQPVMDPERSTYRSSGVGLSSQTNHEPCRMILAPTGNTLLLGNANGGIRRFQIMHTGSVPKLIEVSGKPYNSHNFIIF
jgi:hypothetical protein